MAEDIIASNPFDKMSLPDVPEKLVPVSPDDALWPHYAPREDSEQQAEITVEATAADFEQPNDDASTSPK